jgi:hypothetical protein
MEQFEKYFPARLHFAGKKVYYISGIDEVEHPIRPGDEIIRINAQPVEEIIVRTGRFVPSEGCNKTTKMHALNRRFSALVHPLLDGDVFSVTLRTFGIGDMDAYFNFLDRVFTDLKENGIRNLILDLRDNAGGHPIFAAQLFSYLTGEDFFYFKRNAMSTDLEPLYNAMQPNPKNFNGSLFVLVNGGCLSTTGHLISLLNYHTEAFFFGEEPGSTYRCNDFSRQVSLPNTGIEVNIPQTTFETAVEGFKPCDPFPLDLRIKITVEDVITGENVYVDSVIERIHEDL